MSEMRVEERRRGSGMAFAEGLVDNSSENGRFISSNSLTDQQEKFCDEFVRNGGNGTAASEVAGYRKVGSNVAWHMLKLPKIRARIHELVQHKLETKGGVVGYGVLMEIAQDREAPPAVRRLCARDLMELAGFLKPRDRQYTEERSYQKPLAEMTRAELEAVVQKGAAVLKAAQKIDIADKTIDAVPAQDSAQQAALELPSPSSD